VVEAMEEGIKLAAKKKYGGHLDIDCKIDKKSGLIKLFNKLLVVENDEEDFDVRTKITIKHAKKDNPNLEIGDV
ncbi:MAG: NusA N-terminal domain-containing protein, partial [Alphaproteobacteria bacterium]